MAKKVGEIGTKASVAALALGDEDPPLAETKVFEAQPQHLATAEAAEQHGLGHSPVPIGAQSPP